MRVCDISHEAECVGAVKISVLDDDGQAHDFDLEVGKEALDAFKAQDWRKLHQLTPPRLRPKDESRQAGAAKAAETRARNRATQVGQRAPTPEA